MLTTRQAKNEKTGWKVELVNVETDAACDCVDM